MVAAWGISARSGIQASEPAFLVAVVAIIEGMNAYVKENIAGAVIGANAFTVRRTPLVFGRDGDVALFGAGEFSLSVESIDQFLHSLKLNLQAAVRLGVVNGSIADFAQVAKVAEVSFGEEIIGGLQAWLDLNDRLVGGALSLGVGFSVQFEAEDPAAMPSLFDPRARARRNSDSRC